MIAIRDGRSAVSQQDMLDAVSRLDNKRSQGEPPVRPKPLLLMEAPRFKDPRLRPTGMTSPLVECVPNISEGRDLEKINAIVDVVRQTPGCTVLGVEPDADYHRTVITFAGSPDAVVEGAIALIEASVSLLDMRTHQGEHPRLGVVDVCPFVPLRDVTMEECAELARGLSNGSQTGATYRCSSTGPLLSVKSEPCCPIYGVVSTRVRRG